ncbi:hypothetical protein SIL78_19060, partial [Halomonas alkaliphila]|nr:hypothetical protein [Halomonas alkaliphila]
MADNHKQPGAVGEPGRGERTADAKVSRDKPRKGYAQETESDAVAALDAIASFSQATPLEVKAEPPQEERAAKPPVFHLVSEVPVTLNVPSPVIDAGKWLERIERDWSSVSKSDSSSHYANVAGFSQRDRRHSEQIARAAEKAPPINASAISRAADSLSSVTNVQGGGGQALSPTAEGHRDGASERGIPHASLVKELLTSASFHLASQDVSPLSTAHSATLATLQNIERDWSQATTEQHENQSATVDAHRSQAARYTGVTPGVTNDSHRAVVSAHSQDQKWLGETTPVVNAERPAKRVEAESKSYTEGVGDHRLMATVATGLETSSRSQSDAFERASSAQSALPIKPLQALLANVAFEPASPELALLDPARNGVLAALRRIEHNTAASTLVANRSGRGTRNTLATSDSTDAAGALSVPGSATSLATATASSDTQGLRQKVYRVKRIEKQVDRALSPSTQLSSQADGGVTATADAIHAKHSFGGDDQQRQAVSEGKTSSPLSPDKPGSEATVDAKPSETPLTAEDLRKLPLRNENGQFLSRDEKAGMSKAELAQAKAREERQQAKREEKNDSLLGKLGQVAHDTLTEQGDATDGVGTAVGNAYYSAVKEVYTGYQELAGEDSKGRELYQWARGQWDKRREAGGGTQTDSAEVSTVERNHEEATLQVSETQAQSVTADREQLEQSSAQHEEVSETLETIASTNEDGFEEVVKEVKRIQGGGGTSIIPTRAGLGRATPGGAGGRGGAGGAGGAAGRGRMGRLWDRVRSPFVRAPGGAPGAGAAAPGSAGSSASTGRMASAWQSVKGMLGMGGSSSGASAGAGTGTLNAIKGAGSKALSGGSRLLGAVAAPVTGMLAYSSTRSELESRSDLSEAQKTTTAAVTGVGAGGGAVAGASGGALAGAAAGSIVPVIGTGIGGLIGGIIGGALGAWGGQKAGRTVGDAVASTMDNVEEEARKALDEREERLRREELKERKWYNPATWFSGGSAPQQPTQAPSSFGGMPGAGARAAQSSSQAAESASGDASLVERDDFGRVAEKYESGGRGVSTVSTGHGDPGGVSYGKHQLASNTGTMQAFLNSKEGEAYREEFAGMQAGSDEFSEKYREVADRDAEGFAEAQQSFIARTHYDPVANYAATQGMNIESEAIQEALYSQSVQHSGAGNRKIIDDAMSRVGPEASEDEIIDALYDARGDYASQFVSSSAARDRYAREREDVRAISQASASESQEASSSEQQVAAANSHQRDESSVLTAGSESHNQPDPGAAQPSEGAASSAPASLVSTSTSEVDSRPMTVASALDYAISGSTPAAEPVLPSEPVTPIDDRQAAKAFHPAPQRQPPGASRREPRESSSPAPARQRVASNVGADDSLSPRGGVHAPGVNDI